MSRCFVTVKGLIHRQNMYLLRNLRIDGKRKLSLWLRSVSTSQTSSRMAREDDANELLKKCVLNVQKKVAISSYKDKDFLEATLKLLAGEESVEDFSFDNRLTS